MKILFLDDMVERFVSIKRIFIGCDIKWVTTMDACLAELQSENIYDELHLDHDLADEDYKDQNRKENNGSQLVDIMIQKFKQENLPKKIIIHSWNSVGSNYMLSKLKEAYPDLNIIRNPFRVF